MTIINITGEDYAAVNFEQCKLSIADVYDLCLQNSGTYTHDYDPLVCREGPEYFEAEICNFGEVDPDFCEWIQRKQDYESSKHSNWFIVPDEALWKEKASALIKEVETES